MIIYTTTYHLRLKSNKMSNNPDKIINIPNTLTNNYSGYFLEKSISTIVLKFIKGHDNKTFTDIFFAVGILVGADIIKTIALDIVKDQKKQISDEIIEITKYLNISIPIKYSFKFVFHGFSALSYKFNSLFEKKFVSIEEKSINEYAYSLETSNLFLSNLIKYIENEKNSCEFEKKDDTKLTINKNKISNKIVYSNVTIPYDASVIKITSDIVVDYDNISCTNSQNNIFNELTEKYVKLIDDDKINNIHINILHSSEKTDVIVNGIKMNYSCDIEKNNYSVVNYCYMIIFYLCLKKYEKILLDSETKSRNFLKKIIVVAWIITCYMSSCKIIAIKDIKKIIFNIYDKNFDDGVIKNNSLIIPSSIENIKIKNVISLYEYINNDLNVNKDYIIEKAQDLYKKKETNTDVDIKLLIKPNNSIETVKKFISYVNNLSLVYENKNKIKIYMAKIKSTLVKNTKQNPKYVKYFEEKKNLLDCDKNCSNEKILQLLGIEPEKELVDESVEKVVELTYTNEKYTNFTNLYLSDAQDEMLKTLLNSFNVDKERLEELGIPNKLCLLLHGEPGTGKTTTIITTASYFGRDIFYVSLKNISNNDLKKIFDYVNEKHSNQGIIVLEDFDAMTNVVSKRTNNNVNDNNQCDLTTLLDNLDSGLTLDFFLNVLDGTLTSNNSIVIMTTNHLDKIDPAIYRAGRVDSLIEMKKSDHGQIKKMFKRFILRDIDEKILSQIDEFKYEPAKIIFRLKEFIKKTDTTDEKILSPFITK